MVATHATWMLYYCLGLGFLVPQPPPPPGYHRSRYILQRSGSFLLKREKQPKKRIEKDAFWVDEPIQSNRIISTRVVPPLLLPGTGISSNSRQRILLTREFLERLPLRLRDKPSRDDAQEHEQGIDLQHMNQPGAVPLVAEIGDGALANDGTDLSRGRRDAVRG